MLANCASLSALNSGDNSQYIESITYENSSDGNGVITAMATEKLGLDADNHHYTYVLKGELKTSGQVVWEQSGTCENAGLCD